MRRSHRRFVGLLGVVIALGTASAACGGGGSPSTESAATTAANASVAASLVAWVQGWYAHPEQSAEAVCGRLTDHLLQAGWGKSGAAGRSACHAALLKAQPVQALQVQQPVISNGSATLKVDYTLNGERRADQFGFVHSGGVWLADTLVSANPTAVGGPGAQTAAAAGASTVPAPATTGTHASSVPAKPSTEAKHAGSTQGSSQQKATTKPHQATTVTPDTSTQTLVPPPAEFVATLAAAGSLKESGNAVFRATENGSTIAVLLMKGEPRGIVQQTEVRRGTCSSIGPLVFKLGPLQAGVSNLTLPTPLATFGQHGLVVVVHMKGDTSPVVSCGAVSRG